MKRMLAVAALTMVVLSAAGGIYVWAGCGDTWQVYSADTDDLDCDLYAYTYFTQNQALENLLG